ncbi:hypothetical protein HYPSUDRAFT_209000 [Hypholoma sublateritium FD-334 SS-4]|uniref:Hexokinase N-terminal domain-containing protein n=1 Tax=Hypholoma sublateritium (strain FD-334 SS-4) TaxID=945553 RepID=A0A0D2KHL1_HYPSF|nr:hypothetical protein HYPSUDRAFT_209000 [Hypholoma sublateritium FD-334 SS-4]
MADISAYQYDSPKAVFDLIDHQFSLNETTLVDLTKAFLAEFKVGLDNYGKRMAMIPSFVTGVPDGTETG